MLVLVDLLLSRQSLPPEILLESVSGTNSGGSVSNHTLSIDQLPSHSHTFQNFFFAENNGDSRLPNAFPGSNQGNDNDNNPFYINWTTDSVGSGNPHSHGFTNPTWSGSFSGSSMDFSVQYVDLIIASKD
jgi:hypothetical protein